MSARLVRALEREGPLVATAFMFLSRLPVGRWAHGEAGRLGESVRWFPLVGVVVALATGGAIVVVAMVAAPPLGIAAGLTFGVLLTGAFHEDGLADAADACGAFDTARRLEIMRDSRVGTYGALALLLALGWRAAACWLLLDLGALALLAALVVAHVLARWTSVYLMRHESYVRASGANRLVAEGVDGTRYAAAGVVALACVSVPVFAFPSLMLAWPLAWFVATRAGVYFRRTLGGLTGDALGATNIVAEISILALAVVLLSP